jgi:tagatose 1,6-diphosphate aldolase
MVATRNCQFANSQVFTGEEIDHPLPIYQAWFILCATLQRRKITMFKFLNPGRLTDGEIKLLLEDRYRGNVARGRVPSYKFIITHTNRRTEVGRIDLRIGDTEHIKMYAGHIGYRVHPAYRGHRYAAKACRLLLPLARRHGMKTLWITCNPDNYASRRTCEILEASFVEIVDIPPNHEMYLSGERQKCRYRIDL